jgi:hypothetical protein
MTLLMRVRRYRREECGHMWRQDTTKAAMPRAKLFIWSAALDADRYRVSTSPSHGSLRV